MCFSAESEQEYQPPGPGLVCMVLYPDAPASELE